MGAWGGVNWGDGTFDGGGGTAPPGGGGTGGGGTGGGTPPPVITSFTSSSGSIAAGSSVTLSFVVTGASGISIDNGVGIPPRGSTSVTVTPTSTTTYTITATNAGGSTVATVTITVHGSSGENVRSHQIRRQDREGDGSQIQMYGTGGIEPPVDGYVAVYKGENVVCGAGFPVLTSTLGGAVPTSIYEQIPAGAKDGTNLQFYLDYYPASLPTGTPAVVPFWLYVNGLGQSPYAGQYTLPPGSNQLLMGTAPRSTDTFFCLYVPGGKALTANANITLVTATAWTAFQGQGGVTNSFVRITFIDASANTTSMAFLDSSPYTLKSVTSTVFDSTHVAAAGPPAGGNFVGCYFAYSLDGTLTATNQNDLLIYDQYLTVHYTDGSVRIVRPVSDTFWAGSGGSYFGWAPSTVYAFGSYVVDGNGNMQVAQTTGTSGTTPPAWATLGNTTDNDITWTFAGPQSGSGVGSGSVGLITGSIYNAQLAYDPDSAPPSTYARFTRSFFNGLSTGGYVKFYY